MQQEIQLIQRDRDDEAPAGEIKLCVFVILFLVFLRLVWIITIYWFIITDINMSGDDDETGTPAETPSGLAKTTKRSLKGKL